MISFLHIFSWWLQMILVEVRVILLVLLNWLFYKFPIFKKYFLGGFVSFGTTVQPPTTTSSMPRGHDEVVTNSYQQQTGCKVLKETVFSSEIHSIEYNSPMASMSSGSSSADSPKISHSMTSPPILEAKINNRYVKSFVRLDMKKGIKACFPIIYPKIKRLERNWNKHSSKNV